MKDDPLKQTPSCELDRDNRIINEREIAKIPRDAAPRDVLMVLLTAALIRMEMDKLRIGQVVDLLIATLLRHGWVLRRCDDETERQREERSDVER